MYSRNGNKFAFPNYFVRNWPKAQLDGELFIGRGKFSHTMSAVKRNFPNDILWEQVRFLVFDAPGMKCAFK
jgi:DNA ligase-1